MHADHSVEVFRQKFWGTLLLSIATLLWAPMTQHWFAYTLPGGATASRWIPASFGSLVFAYGGWVLIKAAASELANRLPGMMTLIALGISVAFIFSLAVTFGFPGVDLWTELATLVTVMVLGPLDSDALHLSGARRVKGAGQPPPGHGRAVRGYVLKNDAALNLMQAIDAVMHGEMYLSPGVSGAVVQAYLDNAPPSGDPLSPREREVLQLIAEEKTMKKIGGMLGISARTAESHRARIMSKLKISDVAGLVRYAVSHGLIAVESAGPADLAPPATPRKSA
jgi:DNA-binding CsgD family transcriptional regulator